jgi:hypothetical protein
MEGSKQKKNVKTMIFLISFLCLFEGLRQGNFWKEEMVPNKNIKYEEMMGVRFKEAKKQ